MRQLTGFLILLLLGSPAFAEGRVAMRKIDALQYEGIMAQLRGDFDSAARVESRLLDEFAEPAGHVFALNVIISHLTWNEADKRLDEALVSHAEQTLNWCEAKIRENPMSALGRYYCGQANFALGYHYGLRGSYYSAGRRGSLCIAHLEEALRLDPALVDAKLHLGVAYFVADNLPPFIRIFSRLLWFVPTGNSEKSLPYLLDVIDHGFQYQDAARYIYGSLLLESGEEDDLDLAIAQLSHLVERYPTNRRFQLRLISLLLVKARHKQSYYEKAIEVAQNFLGSAGRKASAPELWLAKSWIAHAYLGMNDVQEASRRFSELNAILNELSELGESGGELPAWGLAWHRLTEGQLLDLAHRRSEAKAVYRDILDIANSTQIHQSIIKAAKSGLATPYTLDNP